MTYIHNTTFVTQKLIYTYKNKASLTKQFHSLFLSAKTQYIHKNYFTRFTIFKLIKNVCFTNLGCCKVIQVKKNINILIHNTLNFNTAHFYV